MPLHRTARSATTAVATLTILSIASDRSATLPVRLGHGNTALFKEIIDSVKQSGLPVKIVKTMCSDSHSRQKSAIELAWEADVVVLVDDGKDASQSVFEVC